MLWRIEFLGRFCVKNDTQEITRFRTHKTAALLAYLAYHPTRSHLREELLARFWPEQEEEAARNQLRVALSALRNLLEPSRATPDAMFLIDRASVRLASTVYITDVAEFQEALQSGLTAADEAEQGRHLAVAIQRYRGPFLPGFMEDWALLERQRLEDAYLGALRRQVRHLTQAGHYDQALDYARQAVNLDPLNEKSHGALMRLYSALGRPAAALSQYYELERILKEEWGSLPSAALQELAAQIRQRGSGASVQSTQATLSTQAVVSAPTLPPPKRLPEPVPPCASANPLPVPFTRFFGHEEELAQLQEMLAPGGDTAPGAPLITLTGPGGSGKTRLAVEIALRLQEDFPNAVWMVSLGDLTDPSLIAGAIADALGIRRSATVTPLEQILAALSFQPALLLLDNFEHLLAGGTEVLQMLRERTPTLRCLVTSRQRLHLAGEREFPVLPLPTPMRPGTPERLMEFASVQLFVDRAQAARRDFRVTPRNAPAIAALCHHLEGIPLALELAAAWAASLTPSQMLARLSSRFDLLVNRDAVIPTRHRTLRAALEWSYRLLTDDLRRLFARLSVFRGGFTLEAAEVLAGSAETEGGAETSPESAAFLESLTQLCERSLVIAEEREERMRYRLLETLREYAADQLTPTERAALADRHAAFFLKLAEDALPQTNGPHIQIWMERQEAEKENLRAAFDWYLLSETGTEKGLRLASALYPFWRFRGYGEEGRERFQKILACPSPPTEARARTLSSAAGLADMQGDYETASVYFEEAVAIFSRLDIPRGMAIVRNNQGNMAAHHGRQAEAQAFFEEAITWGRKAGYEPLVGISLINLAEGLRHSGDASRAHPLVEEALAIHRALGSPRGVAFALCVLGRVVNDLGDPNAAHAYFAEATDLYRTTGEREGLAYAVSLLGNTHRQKGDYSAARALCEEGLRIAADLKDKRRTTLSLLDMALIAHAEADFERTVRLISAVKAHEQRLEAMLSPTEMEAMEGRIAALQATLGEESYQAAWSQGSRLSLEQAVAFALEASPITPHAL